MVEASDRSHLHRAKSKNRVLTEEGCFDADANFHDDAVGVRGARRRMKKAPPKACDQTSSSNKILLKSTAADECSNFQWMEVMAECPTYHPSKEEFEDPLLYVQKIAPQASKYGICKVVPPLTCSVPTGVVLTKELKGFKFTTEIQPLRVSDWKNHHNKAKFYLRGRDYSICDFEKMADKAAARRYRISGCMPASYLEKEFWTEMLHKKKGSVEYGLNVEGSAFSCSSPHDPLSASKWNLKTFSKQSKCALRLLNSPIPGVSEPMLYIGMQFSMFAWHVEDHYLYSINYHHCGAPKTWYGVPGSSALQFEKVVEQNIYNQEILEVDGEDGAFNVLFEKTTMFSPAALLQHHVPVYRAVQLPGEFVITFPQAYHAGFSHGFNCGEAVNFAIGDWFTFGASATMRYALLRRTPIIPYERLLCTEAMLLASKLSSKDNHHESNYSSSSSLYSLKVSFACLMRFHHFVRWSLNKFFKESSLSVMIISPEQESEESSIFCSLCKRECYVAHIVCKCHGDDDPICIFHEREIRDCVCGKEAFRLHLRGDILEMESVAKMFEGEDEEIQQKVELQLKSICDPSHFMLMQNLSTDDQYIPYSEMIMPVKRSRKVATKAGCKATSLKSAVNPKLPLKTELGEVNADKAHMKMRIRRARVPERIGRRIPI